MVVGLIFLLVLFILKYKQKDLLVDGKDAIMVLGFTMPFVNFVMWVFIIILLGIKIWNKWH